MKKITTKIDTARTELEDQDDYYIKYRYDCSFDLSQGSIVNDSY